MRAAIRETIAGIRALPRTGHLAVALGVLGLALMLPFEEWYTRLLGTLSLFGFVALGLWTIASPATFARADEAAEPDGE